MRTRLGLVRTGVFVKHGADSEAPSWVVTKCHAQSCRPLLVASSVVAINTQEVWSYAGCRDRSAAMVKGIGLRMPDLSAKQSQAIETTGLHCCARPGHGRPGQLPPLANMIAGPHSAEN